MLFVHDYIDEVQKCVYFKTYDKSNLHHVIVYACKVLTKEYFKISLSSCLYGAFEFKRNFSFK